jgi:hypothetical protein
MHALALDHNGRRRLPLTVIVQRSGLTERTYLRTARRDNWDDVKLKIIEAMIVGTGVDPMRFAKQRKMLRRHGFKIPHLKPSQQRILDEICAKKVVASESDGLNVPSQR